jgi:hypothetical protein
VPFAVCVRFLRGTPWLFSRRRDRAAGLFSRVFFRREKVFLRAKRHFCSYILSQHFCLVNTFFAFPLNFFNFFRKKLFF